MSNRRPCAKCGSRSTRPVDVAQHGHVVVTGHLCAACLEASLAEADRLRAQLEELLSLGVNRALANEVMIDRINARANQTGAPAA